MKQVPHYSGRATSRPPYLLPTLRTTQDPGPTSLWAFCVFGSRLRYWLPTPLVLSAHLQERGSRPLPTLGQSPMLQTEQ
jgi:hypothetical protein